MFEMIKQELLISLCERQNNFKRSTGRVKTQTEMQMKVQNT